MESTTGQLVSVQGYGFAEDLNPRYRPTMEDGHVFFDQFAHRSDQCFFGVYDGHGGREAVDFVTMRLHDNLVNALTAQPEAPIPDIFRDVFEKTDNEMARAGIKFNGTTAATGFIRKQNREGVERRVIYAANCGDARTVLVKRGGHAVRLSLDHKPNNPEETERINKVNGFVAGNRVNGILSVARALGDHAMKRFIISTPYVSETELTEDDTHLIVACDGVWDVMSDQTAAEIIQPHLDDCQKAAEVLKDQALARRSMDNISCMVIKL
eukprot:gnl/Trimastix_PCT/194.p1 GENE.gnl/Trimastix_PCT/194~~gnl/Trimastix_PCT/194.p1  ORF type:complete len:285 (+),score=35.69 gnl/Trimastix_PCT/194:52-855(+)